MDKPKAPMIAAVFAVPLVALSAVFIPLSVTISLEQWLGPEVGIAAFPICMGAILAGGYKLASGFDWQ